MLRELAGEPAWYWLAFSDDSGFLGACVVKAESWLHGVVLTHKFGINPGGEVYATDFPADKVQPEFVNRLLNPQELHDYGLKNLH